MAYSNDIDALSPDHRWSFDNTLNDQIGTAHGTATGATFVTTPICADVAYSLLTDTVTERVSLPSITTINNSAQTRKAVAGWFVATAIQNPPKNIYGEGDETQAFRIILGWGNYLMFEVDSSSFTLQIFGDVALEVDRPYHLCAIFEGNGYGNEFRAYLDGVKQINAEPTNRQPDTATLAARTVGEFGDPAGTVAVGGTAVILIAPITGRWNEWAIWDGDDAILTDTEVREELFEKGALADITISSGTESAMQTALDSYVDTIRSDAPLCIRIEDCTDGDFTLELDNITFNALASIHVQYIGNDTLTLININGSDCSIVSTPAGGTITLKTRVMLTITVKDVTDFSVIVGARVYIEAETGGDLPDETEIMNTTTNGSGVATVSFDYTSSQPIVGRVRKSSATTFYQTGTISGPITSSGLTQTVLLIPDE